jgi:hypothetical protein
VHRLALASLAVLALAATSASATQFGIRAGLEVPLVGHTSAGAGSTYSFADSLQPAIDVLISAYPAGMIGFDAEIREGFAATGNGYVRSGTSLGPGVTISPPVLPLYIRASVPIHLEPGDVRFDLRGAAGFTFNLVILSIYLEGALDFPLAGNNVTAFNTQQLSLGGGAWFKF